MSFTSKEFRERNQKAHTMCLSYVQRQQLGFRLFFIDGPEEERLKTREIRSSQHICSTCRKAFGYFAYYVSQHVQLPKDNADNSGTVENDLRACAPHHATLRLIFVSLKEDCHLCTILYQKLCLLVPSVTARGRVVNKYGLEMCWLGKFNPRDLVPRADTVFQFSLVDLTTERSSESVVPFVDFRVWDRCDMDLFLPPKLHDSVSERFIGGRTTKTKKEPNTGSKSSRQLAVKWLTSCLKNLDGTHTVCNQKTGTWMPKRLLDVKTAVECGVLKLVTIGGVVEQIRQEDRLYITLSHCWGEWGQVRNGKCNLPILTSRNVQKRHKIGVSLDSLPKTFKDAVMVANWFSVKWLWIDSLCVVQDRLDDWRKTASAMSKIYTHALLNISADAAKDARHGLFNDRELSTVIPWILSIPFMSCSLPIAPSQQDLFSSVDEAPLASRAWVFQERQLASRVLHFTTSQLVWECCVQDASFASELYPGGARLPQPMTYKPKYRRHRDKHPYEVWAEICDLYSELQLSRQTDKLAAIAGMARELSSYLPVSDQYIAGTWRNSLPESLLWSVNAEQRSSSSKCVLKCNMFPSWSWVSIIGPIQTQSMEFNPSTQWRGNSIAIADVTDVMVAGRPYNGGDETIWMQGNISLAIRGVLRPITWYRDPTDQKQESPLAVKTPDYKSYIEFADDEVRTQPRPKIDYWTDGYSIELDEHDPSDTIKASLLLVQTSDTDDEGQWKLSIRCLVLQEVPGEARCFKRIGIARFSGRPLDSLRYRMKNEKLHGMDSIKVWKSLELDGSTESLRENGKDHEDSLVGNDASVSIEASVQSWEKIYSTSLVKEDERYFERLEPQLIKLV